MTRTRETIDSKTFEAVILLVEWAQTAIGCKDWLGDSYARIPFAHPLLRCWEPFPGSPKIYKQLVSFCHRAALSTYASNALTGQSRFIFSWSDVQKGGGQKA